MKIVAFVYEFFNVVCFVAIMVAGLFILLVLSNDGEPAIIPVLLIPIIILILIRSKIASKFEVKKYRSEKRHNTALNKMKIQEQKTRNHLSRRSEKRNIDPLIHAARQELKSREAYITPNNSKQIDELIDYYRENNKVPGVNELYRIIISSNPEILNKNIADYLTANRRSK